MIWYGFDIIWEIMISTVTKPVSNVTVTCKTTQQGNISIILLSKYLETFYYWTAVTVIKVNK